MRPLMFNFRRYDGPFGLHPTGFLDTLMNEEINQPELTSKVASLIELGRAQLALEGLVVLVHLGNVSLQVLHQRELLKHKTMDEKNSNDSFSF